MPADARMRWTDEQRAAISARGADILVSAAAGSGKTSVLVERLIHRLLDEERPIGVDRLLVVTFTESAAAEMKARIRNALLKEAKGPRAREAVRQLSLLGRASISTLHGFCLRVLRRHFHLVGLDPQFRVMDQEEARLLFNGVMDALFERAHGGELDKEIPGLGDLLLHYGGSRDDRDLKRIAGELYEYIASLPDGEGWLARAAAGWEEGVGGEAFARWKSALCRAALADVGQAIDNLTEALRIAGASNGPGEYEPSFEAARAALEEAAGALAAEDWDAAAERLRGVPWPRLKSAKEADPLLSERSRELWNRAKDVVRSWAGGAFCRTEGEYAEDAVRLRPVVSALCAFVALFGREYEEAKRRSGAVDFSDLERMALAVLERDGGRVAAEYREAFDEVMVDEYQDINPVQDRLIALVSRDESGRRNRFLVGDVKQSIYRFRLADPSIFQEKHDRFGRGDDPECRRIDLQANFRSRPEVVEFVNFVFRQAMRRDVGGIAYGPDAFLRAKGSFEAGGEGPFVALHLIERLDQDGEPGPPAIEREARVVGRIILELTKPREDGGPAPFTFRDIAILMRSPKGRSARFTDVLEGMGIPVYAKAGSGFFSAVEVETVLSLLRLLDNPRQDIPLAAVLRSPIVGLSSAELARVRASDPRGSFYDAALRAAREETPLGRRLSEFLERLDGWRTSARNLGLSQLLWRLYHETGYVDFAAALPRGRQREANLWGLYHWARQFDSFRSRGLDRFLAYVDGLEEAGEEVAPPPALGEGENVVQLISVHQSKGLEFPVVIVADLDRQWNLDEAKRPILFHRELGIAPSVVDRDAHVRYPSLAHRAVAVQTARDALAEELRLLYVALTRAKERLILFASARDLESRAARWSESAFREGWPLSPGEVLGARSALDWIGRAAARHRCGEPIRALGAGDLGAAYYAPRDREVAECGVSFSVQIWKGAEAGAGRGAADGAGGREAEERPRGEAPTEATPQGASSGAPEEAGTPEALNVGEALERLYGWSYPRAALTRAPGKVTVSEIARLYDPGESAVWEAEKPAMARPVTLERKEGLSAAERGTAIHLVLARARPDAMSDPAALLREVQALVERRLLASEQAGAVDVERIARFFRGPLGRRIARAERLYRELPFTMRLSWDGPGKEALEAILLGIGAAGGDLAAAYRPVVQGVIDCIAIDGDGVLVVDYKTDRIRPGGEREAAKAYAGQLLLYREFVSAWLGTRGVEAHVVFLETGSSVRIGDGAHGG